MVVRITSAQSIDEQRSAVLEVCLGRGGVRISDQEECTTFCLPGCPAAHFRAWMQLTNRPVTLLGVLGTVAMIALVETACIPAFSTISVVSNHVSTMGQVTLPSMSAHLLPGAHPLGCCLCVVRYHCWVGPAGLVAALAAAAAAAPFDAVAAPADGLAGGLVDDDD
eukprot:1158905-Pelagomonas_calceolata.AAC.11